MVGRVGLDRQLRMHTFAVAGLRSIVWAVFSITHTHTTHCSTTPLRTCRTSRLIIPASGKPDDSPVDICGWTRRLHATRISFPRPSPAWENHCWGSPPVAFNAVAGALADPLPDMVGSRYVSHGETSSPTLYRTCAANFDTSAGNHTSRLDAWLS